MKQDICWVSLKLAANMSSFPSTTVFKNLMNATWFVCAPSNVACNGAFSTSSSLCKNVSRGRVGNRYRCIKMRSYTNRSFPRRKIVKVYVLDERSLDRYDELDSSPDGYDEFASSSMDSGRGKGGSIFNINLTPKEISSYLDEHVIGQSEAKMALAISSYDHIKRLKHNALNSGRKVEDVQKLIKPTKRNNYVPDMFSVGADSLFSSRTATRRPIHAGTSVMDTSKEESHCTIEKSNLLLLGPSGVGKTYLTKLLAKRLHVPIALVSCTSMTQAGYVGEDVESCIQKLLENANGNAEKAQQGIVFLDEFDKMASTVGLMDGSMRDVGGTGVQQALLKLVEGTMINVKADKKTQNGPNSATIAIDTTDILFIASGAFGGLDKIVGRRLDKRSLGFGSSNELHSITADDKDPKLINSKTDMLHFKAKQEDLIKFGLIPELVGRFPTIAACHTLTKSMLIEVLTTPKNNLVAQQKQLFKMDNVVLNFTDEATEEIAEKALQGKTGARALRSLLEQVLKSAKFEVPGSNTNEVTITRDCVLAKISNESDHPSSK